MKIVLMTSHDALSERKTGFHFWADILKDHGFDVDFVTVGSSPITLLKKGGKNLKKPFNEWVSIKPGFRKFTWMPLFHPFNLNHAVLDYITWPLFSLYAYLMPDKLLKDLRDADVFIIENGAGLMLVPGLAKACPKAKFIYNFSDRFQVVKFHPVIPHSAPKAFPHFSLIRLNASAFKSDFPDHVPTEYIAQAIDKTTFDKATQNPYQTPKNAISVGDMIFDPLAIETLAKAFPDWTFHLFGKGARLSRPFPNVVEHGEVGFSTIVPYIKFADIGVAPYADFEEADYLSESSLKLVQYSYCRLPVVAPYFAAKGRDHVMGYDANPQRIETIKDAFRKAMVYNRDSIHPDQVSSWTDVIRIMLSRVGISLDKG